MERAGIPFCFRWKTWSFISAIKGLITRHTPSLSREGTWKQTDFPPPVGSSASVSLPDKTDSIISACNGRKESYPQTFFKISCGFSIKFESKFYKIEINYLGSVKIKWVNLN